MSSTDPTALPLTTTFHPPKSCITNSPTVPATVSGSKGFRYHQGPMENTECMPLGWSPTSYFSPGICPESYTIAQKTEVSVGSVTETRAICCAGGLSIDGGGQTLPWAKTEPCTSFVPQTVTQSGGKQATRHVFYNGRAVSIRWQDTDFPSATPTATATATHTPQVASTGLSTGGKAGVGVGAGVGGLLLILAAFAFAWWRRKRQNTTNYEPAATAPVRDLSPGQRLTELPGGPRIAHEAPSETSHSQTFSGGMSQSGHSAALSTVQSPTYSSSHAPSNSQSQSQPLAFSNFSGRDKPPVELDTQPPRGY